jgi:hypothetical protein
LAAPAVSRLVDYVLTFIGAGTEMYARPGTSGWIGSRVWEVMALAEY